MFTMQREETESGALILHLIGEATVEHAEQLQQTLLQDLQECHQVMLNCEQLTKVDIYAIQMMCSAHRTSVAWDKLLTWNGTLPAVLLETITEAGFTRRHGCSICPDGVFCMWSCQQEQASG